MRAILLAALCLASAAQAEDTKLPITNKWTGRVGPSAGKHAPKVAYIAGPKELAKLWNAWKISDKVPEIDFKKELVLITTSRGSKFNLVPVLDDKGDLKTKGVMTADLTESLGYLIVTVPSKGVKTVNGKAPKLEE